MHQFIEEMPPRQERALGRPFPRAELQRCSNVPEKTEFPPETPPETWARFSADESGHAS